MESGVGPNGERPVEDVELLGVARPGGLIAPGQRSSTAEQVSTVRAGRGTTVAAGGDPKRWLGPLVALLAVAGIAFAITRGGSTNEADQAASEVDGESADASNDDGEDDSSDGADDRAGEADEGADAVDGVLTDDEVDAGSIGSGTAADQPSAGVLSLEIVDAVGEWRPFALPPNTELVLVDTNVLVAQNRVDPERGATRRQLWTSTNGSAWTNVGQTPEGVGEAFATGPMLWGNDGAGGLLVSIDAGLSWVSVPDDGQVETSELLARDRSIAIASMDETTGVVTFRTSASWFLNLLSYAADLPPGSLQCTARTSDGVAIHDNADCSGQPVQTITYDELNLTARERTILRDPQRSAISSFWQVDGDGELRSLRSLDDSLAGRPIVQLNTADGAVDVREADGIEHRLSNGIISLEMTRQGFDGPIGQAGTTQFGILSSDAPTVIARSTESDLPGRLGRWNDTGIRADFLAAAPNVIAAANNPGLGASPPIILPLEVGLVVVVFDPSPSGDRFELLESDATVLRSSTPRQVDFLERDGDGNWNVVIEDQVFATFTDAQWEAAAGNAGYNTYSGLATGPDGPSLVHAKVDDQPWVRTAIAEIAGRPAFIEHLLVTDSAIVVGLTDASIDLEQLLSTSGQRRDTLEWFILDLPTE